MAGWFSSLVDVWERLRLLSKSWSGPTSAVFVGPTVTLLSDLLFGMNLAMKIDEACPFPSAPPVITPL